MLFLISPQANRGKASEEIVDPTGRGSKVLVRPKGDKIVVVYDRSERSLAR